MFRSVKFKFIAKNNLYYTLVRSFLTNEYKCLNAWNAQASSPILSKVNLTDFYTNLEQNHSSKGIISAIDVDIFANAIKDPTYLDELKDLLHKLRLSAETGSTLDSTHHATIRNYMEFGNLQDLVDILGDPLNYGIFLDFYTANLLLDKLIKSQSYEQAAKVASFIMLQEDFTNDITCSLCQYACYKFITEYKAPSQETSNDSEKNKKIEEIKVRIKYLRNSYYDDHFDIKDIKILTGKTLAWTSRQFQDNISNNLQLAGWLFYKKYIKLLALTKKLRNNNSFKIYREVLDLLKLETENVKEVGKCVELLNNIDIIEDKMDEPVKILVENAINRCHSKDVSTQEKMFKNWELLREEKLEDQIQRLNRIKRMQLVEEKQKELLKEEQRLWFFDNEEKIDLEIEEKEQMEDKSLTESKTKDKSDEDYIPPEILPLRK